MGFVRLNKRNECMKPSTITNYSDAIDIFLNLISTATVMRRHEEEEAALLSISVRLRCSFSVSSLTLRRSSSSAFRNSLSPAACSLRWLCSASSASSSLTRPLSAWHKRPLWRGREKSSVGEQLIHVVLGTRYRFLRVWRLWALHLQSERLQLFFEGLDLPRQLFNQTVSDGYTQNYAHCYVLLSSTYTKQRVTWCLMCLTCRPSACRSDCWSWRGL